MKEIRRHTLRFLTEVGFIAAGFIEGADGFVDFFAADRTAGFESVGCGELTASGLLGGKEIAEEDMTIRQSLFDDESIRGMVIERVT